MHSQWPGQPINLISWSNKRKGNTRMNDRKKMAGENRMQMKISNARYKWFAYLNTIYSKRMRREKNVYERTNRNKEANADTMQTVCLKWRGSFLWLIEREFSCLKIIKPCCCAWIRWFVPLRYQRSRSVPHHLPQICLPSVPALWPRCKWLIQMAAHQTDFINPNNINMQIERLHSSSLCIPHRRFDSAESFSRSHEALGLAHFPFAFSRIVLTTCPFLLPFRVYYHVFFLYFAFKHISVAFK